MDNQSFLRSKRWCEQEEIDLIDLTSADNDNYNNINELSAMSNKKDISLNLIESSSFPLTIGSPINSMNDFSFKAKFSFGQRNVNDKKISKAFDQNDNFIPFNSSEINTSNIPWINTDIINSKARLKLHYEIISFHEFIKPSEKENANRDRLFNEIKSALSINSNWEVNIFGSFATNLHLSDSDIDIVVINKKNSSSNFDMLKSIKSILERKQIIINAQIINSNIPIIRAVSNNKINIDISVNKSNSIQARDDINKILHNNPHLIPIICLLKYFLKQRGLNNTYTGGVSSFLLFNMVYAFNNYYRKKTIKPFVLLSTFLIDFLSFYGYDFNYKSIGISIRDNVYFFKKSSNNKNNNQLCVENYLEHNIDIGKLCYCFESKIIKLFKTARNALLYPDSVSDSYLIKILLPINQYKN
jgi:non-canonical poly(A) RNA polymerase PAPD5/7